MQMIHEYKAFRVHDSNVSPEGYQKLRYHFVFDVKINSDVKARWVMDGNFSPEVPREECFASVVSTEAVRLGFILAQVQNLKCVTGDVGNAFLTAFTSEKIYVVAGPEFGEFEGKIMIMVKAVYGTNRAALCFHEALSVCLQRQGFTPSQAEPDFWWQKTKANGFE